MKAVTKIRDKWSRASQSRAIQFSSTNPPPHVQVISLSSAHHTDSDPSTCLMLVDKAALEASPCRIQLIADIFAHDFNNLLTVILGNLELIRIGELSGDDETERLQDAERACMIASSLVKNLQVLTSISASDEYMDSRATEIIGATLVKKGRIGI